MKILLTAFDGTDNSSKIVVNKIRTDCTCDKLVFPNNHRLSVKQLEEHLAEVQYDYILSFGQKPAIKDKIYIETVGKEREKQYRTNFHYHTNFNYDLLYEFMNEKGYQVKLSNNAGTSYCNNIYYHGLHYLYHNNLSTEMIFIHIPFLKNLKDINYLVQSITEYISQVLS